MFLPGTSLSLRRPLGERCVSPCWEGGVSGPRSHAPGRAGRVLGLSGVGGGGRPQPPPTVACERQPGFPVRADWSAAVAPAPSVPLGGPFLPSGREQTRTCQRFWAARSFSPKPGSVRHRPHRGLRPPLHPHVQRPERPLRLQDGSGVCHPVSSASEVLCSGMTRPRSQASEWSGRDPRPSAPELPLLRWAATPALPEACPLSPALQQSGVRGQNSQHA